MYSKGDFTPKRHFHYKLVLYQIIELVLFPKIAVIGEDLI